MVCRRRTKKCGAKGRGVIVAPVLVALLLCAAGTYSQSVDSDKVVKVKAAYILNFAKFIKWPLEENKEADEPLVIGVLGHDPFGSVLDRTLADRSVEGRTFSVRRFDVDDEGPTVDELKSCDMLFISSSEETRVERWLEILKGSDVVTVSDIPQFASRGGMLGFVLAERRIVFEANLQEIDKAKVEVSSKLLRLARIVPTKEP